MSRKRRKYETNLPDADRFISNLKYKDLKRECVIRGLEFDRVLNGSVPVLAGWLRTNFHNSINSELLDHFDDYQESLILESMEKKGQNPDDVIHSSLRLGYIAERDEDGVVTKKKRVRTIIKKKRKRRERTGDGIFGGTKKAMTYELQQRGLTREDVTKEVLKKFPDASDKSIGIWYNKSRKLHGKNNEK